MKLNPNQLGLLENKTSEQLDKIYFEISKVSQKSQNAFTKLDDKDKKEIIISFCSKNIISNITKIITCEIGDKKMFKDGEYQWTELGWRKIKNK